MTTPTTPIELDNLVHVADLSDLDGDEDTDPVDETTRDEITAARTTFAWVVRFEVSGTWVADGFEMTHERALDMLSNDLGYANIGTELGARVLAGPPTIAINKMQGAHEQTEPMQKPEVDESVFCKAVIVKPSKRKTK